MIQILLFFLSINIALNATPDEQILVIVDNSGYQPESIEVKTGTTVLFKNVGDSEYWPASDSHPSHGDYDGTTLDEHCTDSSPSSFDACGPVGSGDTWSFQFDKPGTFSYHDHLWPQLKGEVVVTDSLHAVFFKSLVRKIKETVGIGETSLLRNGKAESNSYNQLKDKYQQIVIESDPNQAIVTLETESGEDPVVMALCHDVLHEIGRAAFAKYGSFSEAIKYQNDFCNSGYIHGIFESYFASTSDPTAEIASQCQEYRDVSQREFDWWQCLHGVGHGFMYATGGDLDESLSMCDESFSKNADYCQNGAYMEVFNLEPLAKEKQFINPDDPFATCREAKIAKDQCYLYMPTYFSLVKDVDFKDMFSLCNQSETGYGRICVLGIGSEAIKRNMNSPQSVISLCEAASTDRNQSLCLQGMVSMYMNQSGSYESGEELCQEMPDYFQDECVSVVKSKQDMF